MTEIQNISENMLFRIVYESEHIKWSFFALQVMIARFKLKLSLTQQEASKQREEDIRQCKLEMLELLNKSKSIPNAMKDIQTIGELFLEKE